MITFWEQLETKQNKEDLEKYLLTKLGNPTNPIQTNLYSEILKKISSYYLTQEPPNQTVFSLLGQVSKITEKLRKTGKHKGQVKYLLEITEPNGQLTILQAYPENLSPTKWVQIQQLALLNLNFAFKYKKWITNQELLDFYPAPASQPPNPSKLIKAFSLKSPGKT